MWVCFNKPMRIVIWLMFTIAGASACFAERESAMQSDHPNIVLILADDMGRGDVSCHEFACMGLPQRAAFLW